MKLNEMLLFNALDLLGKRCCHDLRSFFGDVKHNQHLSPVDCGLFQGFDFIKGSFFFHEIPMKFHEKQAFH